MKGSARARLIGLLQGFWLVPGLIALAIGLLALVMVAVDRNAGPTGVEFGFDGDATAARTILSTVAGSLITVAGLAFSITVVTLQLVSSQFTPRALRTFLADRINQATAGTFVGIFLYCLIVLRSVRTEPAEGTGFIPALSVSTAIALGIVALGLLLTFIHHISTSIQVSNITARVARATLARIDELYPEAFGAPVAQDTESLLRSWQANSEPRKVRASRPGFVQVIDLDTLVHDVSPARVWVRVAPGDFVTPGTELFHIWGSDVDDDELHDLGRESLRIDNERDLSQDAGYGVRQLSDIALKALSPGVNDPTTALNCIGYLRAIMERMAEREMPVGTRQTDDGIVVISRHRSFDEFLEDAFIEVGRYALTDARVAVALVDALAGVAREAQAAGAHERVRSLAEAAHDIGRSAIDEAKTDSDRALIKSHLDSVPVAA